MNLITYAIKLSKEIEPISDSDYAQYEAWLKKKEKREEQHLKELRRIRWNLFKDGVRDKINSIRCLK